MRVIGAQYQHAKEAFAGALKKLMLNRHVDTISVKDIVNASGYSRKTFYNHFQDKENLLIWIFNEDVLDLAKEYAKDDYSSFISMRLNRMDSLDYMDFLAKRSKQLYENRRFYRNAFSSERPNSLKEYMIRMAYTLYRDVISISMTQGVPLLTETEQDQIASFFSLSYVNQLIRNLNLDGNSITPETLLFNCVEIGRKCLTLYLDSMKAHPTSENFSK